MSQATRWNEGRGLLTFAKNISTRYVMIAINALIGVVVLPYNVHHLGTSGYGLWMLMTGVTAYFTALDLGYGGAVIRFVAEYRAKKDARALNEILSTMVFVYAAIGLCCYAAAAIVSAMLPHLFNLAPEQAKTAQILLLITALQVSLYFPFSVFGGVINGFERYYVNNVVGTISNICVAVINVVVLQMGYGLVELVAVMTAARLLPFLIYRRNAYTVFPELSIRRSYFRRDRLRELTGFSVYLAMIDWSSRLTYTTDSLFIGAFLNTTAVGVYAVAQRLSDALLRMTSQLHTFLFPAVVARAVGGRVDSQRELLIKATRFQLAIAVALCGSVAACASTLIHAWVGPGFEDSVPVLVVLASVVVIRAWMAMPGTVLKGTGHHKFVAVASAVTALANLLLSVAGTKLFGIVGCAMATAIPTGVLAATVVFPRACQTVGLSVWQGYRQVVWPAMWPGMVVVAFVSTARHAIPERLVAVLALLAFGALLYVAIFFAFGLGRQERRWMTTAVSELWKRRSQRLATA